VSEPSDHTSLLPQPVSGSNWLLLEIPRILLLEPMMAPINRKMITMKVYVYQITQPIDYDPWTQILDRGSATTREKAEARVEAFMREYSEEGEIEVGHLNSTICDVEVE